MTVDAVCIEDDCESPQRARQRCGTHYQAWRRAHMNTVSAPDDDPRMGWCKRLADLLAEAPDAMFTKAECDLINVVAFTAAASARGVLPLTPEIRSATLYSAVDRIIEAVS